jgi:hypothetical protein
MENSHPLFAFHGGPAMTRTIFSTLLNKFERRLLAKLSTESRRSQSAVIRHLILKEVAQQQTDVSRRRGPDETPHVQRGTARCASRQHALGGSERVPARICGARPCALSQAWVSRRVSPI